MSKFKVGDARTREQARYAFADAMTPPRGGEESE